MPEIKYPEYRDYVSNRVEVNNAMMAMLAGSRLAAHTLQLTAGSTATLGQLFPAVEHIARFNLRSDQARALLHDADEHIASVAIPYALATHEAFVMDMLDMIKAEGTPWVTQGKLVKAWNMHTVFFDSCGHAEPADYMEMFHVLREARNCIIHERGGVNAGLTNAIAAMGAGARAEWERLNQFQKPQALDGGSGRLALTAEHIFTAFAVTKYLGRAMNAVLGSHLSVNTWARIAVADFAASTKKTRNSTRWRRSAIGYARENYSGTSVVEADIEAAARALGLWTLARWE